MNPFANVVYSTTNVIHGQPPPATLDGCACVDGSCNAETCECSLSYITTSNLAASRPIYECHDGCRCSAENCGNRTISRGTRVKLKLEFHSDQKGWCVIAGEDIDKDVLVVEYTGEVIKTEEAKRRWNAGTGRNYIICLKEDYGDRVYRTNIDAFQFGNEARFINVTF